ncbi:hypothetical protein CFII64_05650 [Pseudomonas sp. CFII64]|jgi:hypothetical protein|uniref:hypothetical protein n=1 Tax=Pseudomonas sp. CFII64 TaxID=911242 RepID=UPI0003582C9B|nr:hypothetical protein [Pseudomonas sp. CFII64]EPJ87925.1 hypothetical protein CFII64_05650 [Pseudomonas sp. CFII64]
MAGSRPENPDVDPDEVTFPETVPDPISEEDDPEAGFEPGTELVPEKGDFHAGRDKH